MKNSSPSQLPNFPTPNLYVHFPFCRRKCTYCALHSRAGSTPEARASYVARLAAAISKTFTSGDSPQTQTPKHPNTPKTHPLRTVYFGGGSPALCDLDPIFEALAPHIANRLPTPDTVSPVPRSPFPVPQQTEFTVELHPLDVTRETLEKLKAGGVNRISMGVQSLDNDVLRHMGRGYTFAEAERAFMLVKEYFDNAGIDLIVGYPQPIPIRGQSPANQRGQSPYGHWGRTPQRGQSPVAKRGQSPQRGQSPLPSTQALLQPQTSKVLSPRWARLAQWGMKHCSVYSLILEEKSILGKMLAKSNWGQSPSGDWGQSPLTLPSDDEVLNKIAVVSRFMESIGLERYEISNYAVPGYECRHNMATWQGEDYIGLGEGAHGRIGLLRTENWTGKNEGASLQKVTPEKDALERRIFSLRTREGLSAEDRPEWLPVLDRFVAEGLLSQVPGQPNRYRLTERGTEVCDSILAELV